MKILSPQEIAQASLEAGCRKASLTDSVLKLLVLSMLAGCFIALGGTLSLLIGQGLGSAAAGNPALPKIMSGAMFPIGLILIVVLGGELFTGNNALLMPGCMTRRFGIGTVLRNWTIVWLGNFAGTLLFAWAMVWFSGLTSADPWHTAIINMAQSKCSMSWMMTFVRGIGANWCVCLAVWLALSGHTLLEKMAGCWLPVMAFVALGYEHCVANMFFIPLGMMEGADISIASLFTANLIPATLGNIAGGAIFVGCLSAWLHLPRPAKKA